jgi:predicted dehydrogenase
MDRSKKIRWGILGCGKIAGKFASDLALSKNGVLAACASRDIEKSQSFAKEHKATLFFDTYEALAECTQLDVIYIATPNSYHHDHAILCLKNKKAVLCEKPFAINTSQVENMIKVAKDNNTFLMEAMWTGFLPNIINIQNTIRSGIIGEIIHLAADFGFKADYDPKSRLFDRALGGGSLLDIGIYPIYMSLLFMGKPHNINSSSRLAPSGVDTSCSVLLSYEGQKTAALFSSLETFTDIKCEMYGTKGKIVISNRFHEQNQHAIVINGKADQLIETAQIGFGYYYEIEHVNECLYQEQTESLIMPLEMSLDLMQIMDDIKFRSK